MNRRIFGHVLSLILATLASTAAANATQAALIGDASVSTARPSTNFGTLANLYVGNGCTAFLQFDLSTLPAGTTSSQIARATLTVFVNRVNTAGSVALSPVTSAWTESGVTSNTLPSIGPATGIFMASAAGQYVTLDVTALAQGWVATPAANFGFALTSGSANFLLDSKENDETGHAATLDITLTSGPQGISGPQGLIGPTGADGPIGLQGPAGTNGTGTVNSVSLGTVANTAPAGGGGLSISGTPSAPTININFPASNGFTLLGNLANPGDTQTYYAVPSGQAAWLDPLVGFGDILVPSACTVSALYVRGIVIQAGDTDASTITVQHNDTNTSMSCTVDTANTLNATATCSDTTDTFPVAVGDALEFQYSQTNATPWVNYSTQLVCK